MLRPIIHLLLHLIVPGIAARIGYAHNWRRAWFFMVLMMAIDLDHLLADPVFDAGRCSIGFHPLHTWPFIGVYLLLTVSPRTRIFGIGLMIHIILDAIDCVWMRMT